ncbi:MAG: hypothetical protein GY820_28205, partial [Gammaproteobacteria bacterium]|nr:hypothetical protein [Gammaproteobacteria bacterium]
EVSDADGEETVVYKTQGDEIWALKSGILTKVGDTSEIKSAMDKTAVKELLDAFVKGQEAKNDVLNSEMLRLREERIRDKQEMRDSMKDMLGQIMGQLGVSQANNKPQREEEDNNSQLNASVSNQLQEGALGTEPCFSGANRDQNGQNVDQNANFRKRGRERGVDPAT